MAEGFFAYDWHMDGAPAKFQVDMELDEGLLSERPYLLYVQGKSRVGDLGGRELKKLAALEKKCRKAIDGLYAGSIQDAARQVFFFYTDTEEALEAARDVAARERALACTAGLREEPGRETYHKLLYPDAARLFTEQNRKQILLLQKRGDALTPARRIILHAFFPAEPLAGLFAEGARQAGFAVGEYAYAPEQDLPYGVSLYRISTLDKPAVDEMTTQAVRLAARYDGVLSYWNCPITGKLV